MTIYIDYDYKCYVSDPDDLLRAVETDVFDGKCQTYIEGYRFIPEGEVWIREDGAAFHGQMVAPWQNMAILQAAQRQYELDLLTADEAYQEGVNSI